MNFTTGVTRNAHKYEKQYSSNQCRSAFVEKKNGCLISRP